jgi:hypothetical protein
METRRMILERAGHSVTSAQDLRDVIAACRSEAFEVVILGQSLPRNEKLRIRDVVHIECRNAKVLELHTGITPELPSADGHLHVATGAPEALVDCVNNLITNRQSRGA